MGMSKELLKGLLDNPNFKKWFGESAVRDAEGLPLEVYHGTANSFDTFSPTGGAGAGSRESGLGSWFTENDAVADNFANFARSLDRSKSGPAIIPGNLRMENPWKPQTYDEIRDLVDQFTSFERPGYMFRDRNIRMQGDKVDHAAAVDHLKSQGYDGIMLEKTRVDSPDDGKTLVDQYIAFDPTQFKSRFNQGTFDPTDPNFLKSIGLMTAGAGATYGLAPDEAEAARMPWQKFLTDAIRDGEARALDFGPIQSKLLDQLQKLDDRYQPGNLKIPESIVQKFIDKRVGKDGAGAEDFVDSLNSLFHSSQSKALRSDFPGRQQVVNAGEKMSMLGATEPEMGGGGAIITGYPVPTKRLQRKLNSDPGGRVVSTIPSPQVGAGSQPTRLSDVGSVEPSSGGPASLHQAQSSIREISGVEDGSQNKDQIMPDANTVKKILGLGLLGGAGLGAYDAAAPDDANAMSYIGPKGMANFLGPDKAKALLSEAEQLAAKGVDNEAVRQATGVFQGMDGKWRYELDDSGAGMATLKTGVKSSPLESAVDHDALFYSYPDLARTEFNRYADGNGGSYQPRVNYSDGRSGDVLTVKDAASPTGGKSTLLHELQHAIQQREGFARGGSPSEFTQVDDAKLARDALSFRRELDKMPGGMDSLAKENAIVKDYQDMEAMDFLPSREARDLAHDRDYNPDDQLSALVKAYGLDKHVDMTPKRAYDFLAGEIEARDTAKRMNLTPEQRRATPPDLRDNAIVRFDGNEAASVPAPAQAESPSAIREFLDTVLRGAKTVGTGIDSASKTLGPLVMNAPSRFATAAVNDPVGTASQVADFVVPFKGSAKDYADAFYHNQDATWLDKLNALAGIGLDAAFMGHGNQAKTALTGLMR